MFEFLLYGLKVTIEKMISLFADKSAAFILLGT